MSPQQREAALRLAPLLENQAMYFDDAIEEAAALLRSLAEEPQAEPAGWVTQWVAGHDLFVKEPVPTPCDGLLGQWPVYTHPPAKQEPLTFEEMEDATGGLLGSYSDARAIESACAKKWGVKL